MGRVVRGRARERSAFSPSGGNEAKRTLRGRSDSKESASPVLLRNRDTPSVTFGDSSLGEESKDEGCGFDRLRPQNDGVGAWFFSVWGATSSSQSPHRYVLTSFASLAPPLRAGLVRSTVRPFPTRLVSLVGSPWLAGISRSAPLLVLSRRRRKLRIPHPAASGRLRPLRCSGSPSERRSAFRWVPHSASLGSRGAPNLRANIAPPGRGSCPAKPD